MGKKLCRSHYGTIIHLLQDLKKIHPNYTLGQHLATALSEYGDMWGLTDREVLYALERYKAELEWLGEETKDENITEIIEGGKNLDTLFNEEDNGSEED